MKKVKFAVLALLPAFALASCGEEKPHVSTPKEVITKYYDEDGSVETQKDVYQYDKKGNVTFNEEFSYNEETKKFVEFQKIEYSYDSDGNMLNFIQYRHDGSAYKLYYKNTLTYQDKKLVKEETFNFDKDEKAQLTSYKADFTYDSQNRNTSYNDYVFDVEANKFVKEKNTTMSYKDNIKEYAKLEEKNLLVEEDSMTFVREFNDKGQIVSEVRTTANMLYIEASLYVYNEDGYIQGQSEYFVDYETGAYHLLNVEESTYVNRHYLSEQTLTYYNNDGNIKIYEKSINTYDDKMNLLTHKEYEFNKETNKLEITMEQSMTY